MINQNEIEHKTELRIGDTVHLKSGSPDLMILTFSGDESQVAVTWKDDDDITSYAIFPTAGVVAVSTESGTCSIPHLGLQEGPAAVQAHSLGHD